MIRKITKYLLLLVVTLPLSILGIAQSNQYLHFDGVNDYISYENAAAALNGSNTISMAGWFYTDALVYGQGMLSIRGGGSGSGEMYVIQLSDGVLECRATTTTGLKNYHSPTGTIVAGTWQHLAWVMNTDSIRLYINGNQVGKVATSGTFQSTDKPFTVGRCIASNFEFYYGGRADEVSLWNKALSATEIQNMMSNELVGSETNLVAYYKFNQGYPGNDNTSITHALSATGTSSNAILHNFALNGNSSNFLGTLQAGLQAISFPGISSKITSSPAFQLNAISSSGLAVSYSIVSGPATVSGNTLTLNGTAGTVVVRASQAGDATYSAATDVDISFEVLDPATVLVNATILHPLAGNVYAPNLTPIKVAVRADIAYPDLFNVQNVTANIDGTAITLTNHGNGFYTGWWTPTSYGTHQLNVIGTNNHNVNSTTSLDFNLAQSASSIVSNATFKAWVKDDISVVVQESDLPSHIGAYDQIIGKLKIECPTGGCDPWDRVSTIEVQGKDGDWYEIVRYLTPYGVACQSQIDLTDFASLLLGKTKFRITLGTQGNGFLYTLDLEYRAGTPAHAYSYVQKLWNSTYQFGDMANLQPYEVLTATLDANAQKAKLKLVATGHGWGNNNTGNAAEFQRNKHHIYVNGVNKFEHDNWNTCNPNPDGCSPQYGTWQHNRAGWCPGSIAQFFNYDLSSYVNNQTPIELRYMLDESYKDLCHPNNPNCVSGTTCPDCNDNFNPHLVTSSYFISFANSPTGGSLNLPNIFGSKVSMYPNPSAGKFYVDFGNPINGISLNIVDIAGRSIYKQDVANGSSQVSINLTGKPSGVYLVNILQNGKQMASKRIVIE